MLFPQQNNWRAGMQDVAAAIDETMGELVTVMPFVMTKVNYPTVPDRTKPVLTVTAVFRSPAQMIAMGNQGGRLTRDDTVRIQSSNPTFDFSYGVLRSIPYPLLQGYRIQRCCDGVTYEITNIKPDGVSRTCVHVVHLGRAGAF